MTAAPELEYVGFWPRVGATIIDTLWISPLLWLLGSLYQHGGADVADRLLSDPAAVSGSDLLAVVAPSPYDFVVDYLVPALLVVVFWVWRGATPGKLAIGARIVDATSGAAPTRRQLLLRYVGYYVSILPCLLGLVWVAWDPRKQGFHDKIANTVVVRERQRPVFPGAAR